MAPRSLSWADPVNHTNWVWQFCDGDCSTLIQTLFWSRLGQQKCFSKLIPLPLSHSMALSLARANDWKTEFKLLKSYISTQLFLISSLAWVRKRRNGRHMNKTLNTNKYRYFPFCYLLVSSHFFLLYLWVQILVLRNNQKGAQRGRGNHAVANCSQNCFITGKPRLHRLGGRCAYEKPAQLLCLTGFWNTRPFTSTPLVQICLCQKWLKDIVM